MISPAQLPELPALVALTAVFAQYGPAALGEYAITSRLANSVTPLSIHSVTPEGSVSGPLMNALPTPLLLTTRRTANLLARYCALASSSPEMPEMFLVGSAAAFCCAVAAASADAMAAPTSASTAAPQTSSAAWMRAWSGLAVVALTATPTPETDGSASGGSAPSGRLTSLLLASSVAQTCVSVGSAGSPGRFASVLVVPTCSPR